MPLIFFTDDNDSVGKNATESNILIDAIPYSRNQTISYLPNELLTKTTTWATQLEHYVDSTISDYGRALISPHYI